MSQNLKNYIYFLYIQNSSHRYFNDACIKDLGIIHTFTYVYNRTRSEGEQIIDVVYSCATFFTMPQ